MAWNEQMDAGKPFCEGVAELSAIHPEWTREIEMYFHRWIEMMGDEIEGMYSLLQDLKEKGCPLYGLTNWSSETFCQVRDRYRIFRLLDGMVVSGEEHCLKPYPEIYHILLDRYHLNPAECIFIDDRASNLRGAEAVGIRGILFTGAGDLNSQLLSQPAVNQTLGGGDEIPSLRSGISCPPGGSGQTLQPTPFGRSGRFGMQRPVSKLPVRRTPKQPGAKRWAAIVCGGDEIRTRGTE